MKKITFTFLILFLHFSLFSQSEKVESKLIKSLSVNLKQVHLKSDDKNYSILKSSFGIGLEANYFHSFNSKWALKTGIELSYLSSKMEDYSLIFGCDINIGLGINEQHSFTESSLKWYYIGVPIEFQFNIINNENRLYLKAGGKVLVKIFDDHSILLYECGINPRKVENLFHKSERVIGEVNIGLGYEFNIRPKVKLFLEPNIEYHMTNIFEPLSVFSEVKKSRRLNYGLKMGVRF